MDQITPELVTPVDTQVPLPSPSLPPTTPVKQPRTPIIGILLGITAFALGAAGYFGYKYYQINQKGVVPSPTPTEITKAEPSPTPDPTADWKTYTNTALKIQFKHPSLWTMRGFAGDVENYQSTDATLTRFAMANPDNSLTLAVGNDTNEMKFDPSCNVDKQTPTDTKILDGSVFTKTVVIVHCAETGKSTSLMFSNSNKQLSLQFHYNMTSQAESEKIIDQILSTFKFSSPTNSAANEKVVLTEVVKNNLYESIKSRGTTGIEKNNIEVSINKIEGDYAMGSEKIIEGPGGVWFAAKINGSWKVIEETQEPPSCQLMTQYQFPKSVSGNCIEK